MILISDVVQFLDDFAPPSYAEDWDNVGFILGDRKRSVSNVMTCLTITPDVIDEAQSEKVDLIVSHHPFPFRPMKKITTDDVPGRMLLELAQAQINVYSPHTSFDSAARGINQSIAETLDLMDIKPLIPFDEKDNSKQALAGVGRMGQLSAPRSGQDFCKELKKQFHLSVVKFSGDIDAKISIIGIACGSAGQFLSVARANRCDAFITGETNFHTCLEAIAHHQSLFLLGHYGSERFAVEWLANHLSDAFPSTNIWASRVEKDPVEYY